MPLSGQSRCHSIPAGLPRAFLLGFLLALRTTPAADVIEQGDRKLFADGLYSRGLHNLALPEYESLSQRTPPPPELDRILFRLGECQRLVGRAADAEASFRRLTMETPDSPLRHQATLKRALIILEMGMGEAAAGLLAELAKANPAPDIHAAALYHAGEAHTLLEKPQTAIEHYEALRRKFPKSDLAPYSMLRQAALHGADASDAGKKQAMNLYRTLIDNPPDARLGAEALFQAATLAFNRDEHAEAAALFQRLLQTYPQDQRAPEALLPAAWAAFHAGRFADALSLADRQTTPGSRAGPEDEWLYLRANSHRQLGQLDEAVTAYERLAATQPKSTYLAAARYERLLTLFRAGRHAQVLEDAAAVAPPEQLRDDLLWLQAEAAEVLEDTARATQFYRLLTANHPDSPLAPDAAYRLGYQLQRQEHWAEASRVYLDLADRFPKHALAPQALFASGLCLARAGRDEEALRDWHRLLIGFPAHESIAETLFQKAMVETRREADRDAAATLDELLRRFPTYERLAEARFWRAQHYYGRGEMAEAERMLRAALEVHPPKEIERETHFLLGLILQADGREEEAAAIFQPLLAAPIREKFSPDRLRWLAEFQFSRGEWKASEEAARSLLRLAPSDDWKQAAWMLLARGLRARNQRAEAIEALEKTLACPARTRYGAEAALRLGEMRLEDGDAAAAEEPLREAATRAATPELQNIRATAYAALARAAEQRGDKEAALRYYMSVAILFDDATLVPPALDRAATLLTELERLEESQAAEKELQQRYPDSQEAIRRRSTIPDPDNPGETAP